MSKGDSWQSKEVCMYAIEFEADIKNGVVKIPAEYSRLKNARARVVVMVKESSADSDVKALSEHSANIFVDRHSAWSVCFDQF
jgi:hypothetical protein